VCVCLSVREDNSRTTCANFAKFLCMLPVVVARFSFGGLIKSQMEGAILGVYFSIYNALYEPYSGMNFVTKDRFCLHLLIYRKVGQNSISGY